MATVAEYFAVLKFNSKDAVQGVNNFGSAAEKTTKKASSSFKGLGASLTGLFAGIGITNLVRSVIDEAATLGESVNAINVVFGEASKEVLAFGENAAKSVGLSNSEFNALATSTGTLLKSAGVPVDELGDRTITLTERAADLASVFDTDVKLSLSAINQALRGESEAIRAYGADVTNASLDTFLLSKGIDKTTKDLSRQEKQLLIYEKILSDTDQVQGDFANTITSLPNQLRVFNSSLKDSKASLGEAFLAPLALVVGGLNKLISVFNDLSPETKKVIQVIIGVVSGFLVLGTAISILTPLLVGIGTLFAILFSPITLIIGAIGLVTFAIYDFYQLLSGGESIIVNFINKLSSDFPEAFNIVSDVLNKVIGVFKESFEIMKNLFGGLFDLLTGDFQGFINNFSQLGDRLLNIINKIIQPIKDFISLKDNLSFDGILDAGKGIFEKGKGLLDVGLERSGDFISGAGTTIQDAIITPQERAQQTNLVTLNQTNNITSPTEGITGSRLTSATENALDSLLQTGR